MPMDDLFKALNMFSEGVKDLQTRRTINGANDQVQEIKASDLKEEEKQSQYKQVANQLTIKMAGLGVPATTIQAVGGAVRNDPTDFEQAIKMNELQNNQAVQKQKADQAFQTQQKELDRQNALEIAKTKVQGQLDNTDKKNTGKGGKPISPTELKKISDLNENKVVFSDLLDRADKNKSMFGIVNKVPGVTGVREAVDPEFADFKAQIGRGFDIYRKNITGAQATVKEIDLLKKNTPTIDEPYPNFVKKIKTSIRIGDKVLKRYQETLQQAGRDVKGFSTPVVEEDDAATTADDTTSVPDIRSAPVQAPGAASKYFKKRY